jgi:putative peptide zinc metalloprotease protein
VVTFSIIFFLSQVLKPYKLQSISYMLAIGSLIPLLAMPVYQIGKFVRTPGRMRKVKKARAAAFVAAFVAVVAGILLIPTPLRIQGTLVLSPADPVEVYPEVEGQLADLKVVDGQWVKEGTVLAQLINHEKEKERIQRQAEHDTYWTKAQWYNQSSDSRAQAKQHELMAEQLEPSITKINEQLGKLTLTASHDGQVIGVPHHETLGQWLKPGKPFCQVADPHHLEARLIIDQSDIDLIDVGRKSWVKVNGRSETTLVSKVAEIAKRNRDEIPPELSNLAGGEIATKPDQKTGQAKPLTTVYEVIIPIENPSLLFHPGQRGFAKIDAGTHTFGWWLWRLVTKTFHFNI